MTNYFSMLSNSFDVVENPRGQCFVLTLYIKVTDMLKGKDILFNSVYESLPFISLKWLSRC